MFIALVSIAISKLVTFHFVLKHTIKIISFLIYPSKPSLHITLIFQMRSYVPFNSCSSTAVRRGVKLPCSSLFHSLHIQTPIHLCVLLLWNIPLTSPTNISPILASLPSFFPHHFSLLTNRQHFLI